MSFLLGRQAGSGLLLRRCQGLLWSLVVADVCGSACSIMLNGLIRFRRFDLLNQFRTTLADDRIETTPYLWADFACAYARSRDFDQAFEMLEVRWRPGAAARLLNKHPPLHSWPP